jgi:hypothetical protein
VLKIKNPDLCWKCQKTPMIGTKEVFLIEGTKYINNNLCQQCYDEEEKIKLNNNPKS